MDTKEYILEKYKFYILKKSLYNALSVIFVYIILMFFISLMSIPFNIVFSKNEYDPWNSILPSTREIIKAIYNLVPLKDNILTALGALVLTLFISVRSENKEINGKSGNEVSTAGAYKKFSDIIITWILGPIMFINFCAKILLGDAINNNDQTYPWVSLFFMVFILIIRYLDGNSVASLKEQILQTKHRISAIKTHSRTSIIPKSNILYSYKQLKPFRDLIIKITCYISLKYNIRNLLPKVLLQFLFILYIFYTALSITKLPYFSSIEPDYTLEEFIQNSIQKFHQLPYTTPEDAILPCLFSIAALIIFIICDILYLMSEEDLHSHCINKIIYCFIVVVKITFLLTPLLYIISDGTYILEGSLFKYTILIISTIGYFIISHVLTINYIQKLNQDLGLSINQSLNEIKTSAELYYLNTKLEFLYDTLKTMLEETQDNYIQWKNSSNIDSDNINSSCE